MIHTDLKKSVDQALHGACSKFVCAKISVIKFKDTTKQQGLAFSGSQNSLLSQSPLFQDVCTKVLTDSFKSSSLALEILYYT